MDLTVSVSGSVLDQLDQAVAINDLAGRRSHVATDLEILRCGGRLVADQPLPVLQQVAKSVHEVPAAGLRGSSPVHDRVRHPEIRRRHHVEDLPGGELDDVLVLSRDPVHVGCRVVPPLLLKKEALVRKL